MLQNCECAVETVPSPSLRGSFECKVEMISSQKGYLCGPNMHHLKEPGAAGRGFGSDTEADHDSTEVTRMVEFEMKMQPLF